MFTFGKKWYHAPLYFDKSVDMVFGQGYGIEYVKFVSTIEGEADPFDQPVLDHKDRKVTPQDLRKKRQLSLCEELQETLIGKMKKLVEIFEPYIQKL